MKKLLVLTLVLGMASLASASLSIVIDGVEVGGEITIAPSDTIMIGVCEDTDGSANYTGQAQVLISLATTDLASWTGVTEVYSPPAIIPATDVWTYYGTGVDPSMDVYFGDFASGSPTDYALAGVFGELGLHCDGEGDVVITLMDSSMNELDTIVIHQLIPEPMTMALLGLGGLFLRRRR